MRSQLLTCLAFSFATTCAFAQAGRARMPVVDERPLDSLTTAFLARFHPASDTSGWGLSSSTLAIQLTQALQQQGVDTLLYFRSACSTCPGLPTPVLPPPRASSCSCNTTEFYSYLYWQYHGRTFVKQLDCCYNHGSRQTTSEAFDFYVQHRRVLEQGAQFSRALRQYNQSHPTKPRYLTVPISQGDNSVHLTLGRHQLVVTVWEGLYDAQGTPLARGYAWRREDAVWRRKQWEWTTRLKELARATAH